MSIAQVLEFLLKYKVTLIFYSFVLLFVYLNRKKFDMHGSFVALYRTKIGIKWMNSASKKYGRFLRFIGYIGIYFGFIGIAGAVALIAYSGYKLILKLPGATGASPVIPGFPIAGTGLEFPLISGWIALFVIILVHEFSHGVIAVSHKIKVKNSGIAFFGPIFGAFVEPDEKRLLKQKDSVQHSVFAIGPFSNFLLYALIVFIVFPLFTPLVNSLVFSTGVIVSPQQGYPAELAGMANFTVITKINNISVTDVDEFKKIMEDIESNQTISIDTTNQSFLLTTIKNPDSPDLGYLGVWVHGNKTQLKNDTAFYKAIYGIFVWLINLLVWVAFLSINIGLINLFPIFITDGARMLKVACDRVFRDKKRSAAVWMNLNWFSVLLLLILVFLPLFRWIITQV